MVCKIYFDLRPPSSITCSYSWSPATPRTHLLCCCVISRHLGSQNSDDRSPTRNWNFSTLYTIPLKIFILFTSSLSCLAASSFFLLQLSRLRRALLDISQFWREWIVCGLCLLLHLALTFGIQVQGCPRWPNPAPSSFLPSAPQPFPISRVF